MSRIGKRFIKIPEKVTIKLDGQKITVVGPKGNLSRILPSLVCCTLDQENQKLMTVKRISKEWFEEELVENVLFVPMLEGVD